MTLANFIIILQNIYLILHKKVSQVKLEYFRIGVKNSFL